MAKTAGDLQFLCTDSGTSRANKITHVTMVASPTQIVHARGTKYGVCTNSISLYAGKVCGVVRYKPGLRAAPGDEGLSARYGCNRRSMRMARTSARTVSSAKRRKRR